jgi:hypothetical protein
MRSAIFLVLLASPAQTEQCSAPVAVPQSVTTPDSTYYSDAEPPKRFSHPPSVTLRIRFGQDAIDKMCGKPACGYVFEGCTRGNEVALPDPYSTDSETFARIVKHELAHVNGWPATHGD